MTHTRPFMCVLMYVVQILDALVPAFEAYKKAYRFEGVGVKQVSLAFLRGTHKHDRQSALAYALHIHGLIGVQFCDLSEVDMADAFSPLSHVPARAAPYDGPTSKKRTTRTRKRGREDNSTTTAAASTPSGRSDRTQKDRTNRTQKDRTKTRRR